MLNDFISYWPMDEASGNISDLNGNTGTVTGTTVITGIRGNARRFNGTTDFIGIGDITALEPANITVACWIRTSTATEQFIISKENIDVTADRGYSLRIYDVSNAKIRWVVWKNGTSGSVQGTDWQHVLSAATYADGNWHHIVGTWNGTTLNLYIDGIAEPPVNFSGTIKQTSVNLEFGRAQNSVSGKAWFNGDVDEVRIYNRALNAVEAYQLFTFANTYKFNNSGIRPRPFAPGLAR